MPIPRISHRPAGGGTGLGASGAQKGVPKLADWREPSPSRPRRVAAIYGQRSPDTWSNVMAACWFSPASQSLRGTSTYAVRSCVRERAARIGERKKEYPWGVGCGGQLGIKPRARIARIVHGPGQHSGKCFKGGPAVKQVRAAQAPSMPACCRTMWYAPVTPCRPLAGPE